MADNKQPNKQDDKDKDKRTDIKDNQSSNQTGKRGENDKEVRGGLGPRSPGGPSEQGDR
jgi:hypothetical protein